MRRLLYRRLPEKNLWAPEVSGTALFALPRSFFVSVISQLAGFLQSFDALDTSGQLSRSFEISLSRFPIFVSRICFFRRHVSRVPGLANSPWVAGPLQLKYNFCLFEPFR